MQRTFLAAAICVFIAFSSATTQAAETITENESEQVKRFEKAIRENPEIRTITTWFGSPEYLVKRYNRGKKAAEASWLGDQAHLTKIKELGTTKTLEVLPLIDWYTANDKLIGEAGVSYFIKTDQSAILFDVGLNSASANRSTRQSSSPLLHNMRLLGLTIDDFDTIVISHNHMDHVGGRAWAARNTFSLTHAQIGLGSKQVFTPIPMTYPGLSPTFSRNPTRIAEGVASTGVIANQLFFFGLTPEQAIAANVEGKGIVLIVGCGHQTLPKLLERVEALFDKPVYGVIGGLHYPVTDSRLKVMGVKVQKYIGTNKVPWKPLTLEDVRGNICLLKKRNPGIVALSAHDSCDASIEEFRRAFGKKYKDVRVGEKIVIGKR